MKISSIFGFHVVLFEIFVLDVHFRLVFEKITEHKFPNFFPNFFREIFASSKNSGFSEKFPNFENRTFPKLAKTKSSEKPVFRRALDKPSIWRWLPIFWPRGVNFINILRVPFSYETFLQLFSSYSLALYFLAPKYRSKSCSNNVSEIDYR